MKFHISNIVYYGDIVRDEGHEYTLKLLHSVHQGISRTTAKARGVIR